MKDQRRLLNKCIENEIPVFVLCRTDSLSVEILNLYYQMAEQRKCSNGFIDDLKLLINDFAQFQEEEPEKVKLPD